MGDVTAHAQAAQTQRKHCCYIVGRVYVAGVVWQWIYMSQYYYMAANTANSQ
jgi:hypothetical protein